MKTTGTDMRKKTARRWPRKTRTKQGPAPVALPCVSQETRDRLYAEAQSHPSYEGMEEADIRLYIDERLDLFLAGQPWWYGHTGGQYGADTKHHASRRQYQARREKENNGRALANGVPIEETPDRGGETATSGSEERLSELLAA